ncbi:hypothetical protein Tco_0715209 [Tanacetum coccineum]
MEQMTSICDMVGQYMQKKEEDGRNLRQEHSSLMIVFSRVPFARSVVFVITNSGVKGISETIFVLMPDILPTLPTFDPDLDFTLSHDFPLGSEKPNFRSGYSFKSNPKRPFSQGNESFYLIRPCPLSPVFDTMLPFSSENEDKVFNPGILISPLLSHRGEIISNFSKSPMMIFGGDIPYLDVSYLHFYPLDLLSYGG